MTVDRDVALLRRAGVDVRTMFTYSDEIPEMTPGDRFKTYLGPLWSVAQRERLRSLHEAFQPDVLHLHNAYPGLSPSVIPLAQTMGLPIAHTVHNQRLDCPAGTFYRDGHICQDCTSHKHLPLPAIAHGCYRGSRAASSIMAASAALYRTAWRNVDRYVVLSDFAAKQQVARGVPPSHIVIRPNYAEDPGEPVLVPSASGAATRFLFVGRLDEQKGIELLIQSWRLIPTEFRATLTIVGDGPEAGLAQSLAFHRDDVEFLGRQPPDRVAREMRLCDVVLIPSECYDSFPSTMIEAWSHARPVLASSVGPLPSVIGDDGGWTAPANPEAFSRKIASLIQSVSVVDMILARSAARARYERDHTESVASQRLIETYHGMIKAGQAGS